MEDTRRKRRVFPERFRKTNLFFIRISKDPAVGVVITGVSAPVFNTRRFRRPFST